jgi:glycine/D-amino acid oxidase-like deaminating enzyme
MFLSAMHEIEAEAVIIGAGVAGLSTALHLAQRGLKNIVVLDEDLKLGGHASGRNAGMIRQTVSDPFLAKLAVEGRRALGKAGKLGWRNLKFCSPGSLLLAKGQEVAELEKIRSVLQRKRVVTRWLSKKEAGRRVTLIRDGDFEKALFCPSDALLDIGGLLRGFLKAIRRDGVSLYLGHGLRSVRKKNGQFVIFAGDKVFRAGVVVNASGAWAGLVSHKAEAAPVPLRAYRRHLYVSRSSARIKPHWPFVWDLTHHFYFRPVSGRRLLLSPCDKVPFRLKLGSAKGVAESIDPKMRKELLAKLSRFSPHFGFLRIEKEKAGLRTMTPDGRFVIGEDQKQKGFFWVAGLGGHGVTTCLSVGKLASSLILGKKTDFFLKKALSPGRFV